MTTANATYGTMPIADIIPGDWNPRHHRNKAAADELEASVRANGVIQPIVVRPARPGDAGLAKIVAGERRWSAAKAAGLLEIPIVARPDLTDAQCQEIACIENLNRDDLHALDEAEAYARLKKVDPLYTDEALAARFGKPLSYIRRRLRLLDLPKNIRTAFLEDVLTPAHAEKLAKVPKDLQQAAFVEGCFLQLRGADVADLLKADKFVELRDDVASAASLQQWIERRVRVDLADPEVQEKFPELAPMQAAAKETGAGLLEVSEQWQLQPSDRKRVGAAVVERSQYREIKVAKDRCKTARRAIVVHGGRLRFIEVCLASSECPTHYAPPVADDDDDDAGVATPATPSKAAQEEQRRKAAHRAFCAMRGDALRAMVPTILKAAITPAVVRSMLRPHQLKEISRRFGIELNDRIAPAALLLANHLAGEAYDRGRLAAAAKAIGFDLVKYERAEAAKKKAAAMAPKLKGGKAPAAKKPAAKAPAKKTAKKRAKK